MVSYFKTYSLIMSPFSSSPKHKDTDDDYYEYDDPNFDYDAEILGTSFPTFRFFSHSPSLSHATEDESPYPEVRSAVANTDDPDMPVNTLRYGVVQNISLQLTIVLVSGSLDWLGLSSFLG